MAYGDECPLVALNYVRAAATNLALADASAPLVSFSHAPTVPPVEKHPGSLKLAPLEMTDPAAIFGNLPNDAPAVPTLASYGDPKANSSLLKRLAEKFGLPR